MTGSTATWRGASYATNQTVANAAIVPVSDDGKVTVYTSSTVSAIVDVVGWFATSGEYHPVESHRTFDSRRAGDGPAVGPGANDRLVTVGGVGGVPSSGVSAVAMTVTVANPTQNGYLVVYPGDVDPADRPWVSMLNYAANQAPRANATIAAVGLVADDGTIRIHASGTTHVIVDVVGWFAEPPEPPEPQPAGINYTHDAAGRVTAISFDDPGTDDVYFTYDGRGLRTSMVDGRGTTTYTHDEVGRLTHVDGPDGVFTYTYDPAGRVATRGLPDGRTLGYTYDGDGHVTSVTDGTRTTTYTWDRNGNLTGIVSPNGAVETRGYDNDGHLVTQTVTSNGAALVDKAFTVDEAGRVTRVDDTGTAAARTTTTYGYDLAGRLLEECHQEECTDPGDPFTRWGYDDAGRRISETAPAGTTTYVYDVDGNLATTTGPDGTTTYIYDQAGRRTAENGPAGTRSYVWDAAGRLASVADSSGVTWFSYTGDGTRVGVSGPAGDTNLTWDSNGALPQPVAVTVDDGAGLEHQQLAWGPTGAPAWATVDDGAGPVLQVVHADQVWNPTTFTDTAGQVTHTALHDAWGNRGTVTAVNPAAPAPAIGHSSMPAAAAADGLVHLRARDYDPGTGQFLTPDPWVRPDGQPWIGSHAYTDGDPVSYWDPSGLIKKPGGTCGAGPITLPTWASGSGAEGCKGGTFFRSAKRSLGLPGRVAYAVWKHMRHKPVGPVIVFPPCQFEDIHGRNYCDAPEGPA